MVRLCWGTGKVSYKGQLNNLCEHVHANYVNLKKLLISGVTIFLVSVSSYGQYN